MFWFSDAFAQEASCPPDSPPALAVVLWDRVNPASEFFGFEIGRRFGTRQYEMREDFLNAALGLEGFLEPGDQISIFPHGFSTNRIAKLAASKQPGDLYTPLKGAFPGGADPVQPVHWTLPGWDLRPALSEQIQRNITFPLLNSCDDCPDERGRTGDDAQERDTSQPWLLTHNALAAAYVAQGLDQPCKTPDEVYLVWVTSEADLPDLAEALATTQAEIGGSAAAWLKGLETAYSRELVSTGRHVQVWRIHRAASRISVPTWQTTDGKRASISQNALWHPTFAQVPEPEWFLDWPSGWTLESTQAKLRSSADDPGIPVPLRIEAAQVWIADPAAVREQILNATSQLTLDDPTLTPTIDTTIRAVPPPGALFGWTPVAIAETTDVPSPPMRITYAPLETWQVALMGGGTGLTGLLLVQQVWARVRRRKLHLQLALEGPDHIDLMQLRDKRDFRQTVAIRVTDASGYRPRRADLEVRVSLQLFLQPEIPLREAKSTEFQRLFAAVPFTRTEDGWSMRMRQPGGRINVDIETAHSSIDFGRIRQDELTLVHALRIQVRDSTKRYELLDELRFLPVHLKAVPGPAEPAAQLQIAPSCLARWLELQCVGVDDPTWRGTRRVDIGWLVLENPARHAYTPLPVRIQIARAVGTCRAEGSDDPPLSVAVQFEASAAKVDWELAANERAQILVRIELPDEMRRPERTLWVITLEIELTAEDGNHHPPPLPKLKRSFRVRTAGRSRTMVLDFGSGTTRMLLQDLDEERWGFLPLSDDGPDLPAGVVIDGQSIWFGKEADQHRLTPGARYVDSIKAMAFRGGLNTDVQRCMAALLAHCRARMETPGLEGWRGNERIALATGPRDQLVVLVPNESPPSYIEALRSGIAASGFAGAVVFLFEAEASALWWSSVVYSIPSQVFDELPRRIRILLVDFGAGTADAALVEVERPVGASSESILRKQRLDILATGGAAEAGRSLDEALFAAFTEGWFGKSWSQLDLEVQRRLRPELERAKWQLNTPKRDVSLPLPDGRILAATTDQLANSDAWQTVVRRVVRGPLEVLLGRLPAHALSGVHLTVLTGRASQAKGLVEAMDQAVQAYGAPGGKVMLAESAALKAAVSLGARLYALGLCGDFSPSHHVFRDRILLVFRQPQGEVGWVELLAAQTPFQGGAIVGAWMQVPSWEAARLVQTWMVPTESGAQKPWELDPVAQVRLLNGETLDREHMVPSWRIIPFDANTISFTSGSVDDLHARIRVVVDLDGRATLECEAQSHVRD